MHLSSITFIRILLLWFTFHSTTTSAIDLTCHAQLPGKECPKSMADAYPYFKGEDKKNFPAAVLRGVLHDQLQQSPMVNVAYVFVISWPGNIVQNAVNRGSHIGIIIARFIKDGYNAAHLHHLGGPDECNNRHDWEDWDEKNAFNALRNRCHFQALGPAKLSTDMNEVNKALEAASKAYFEKYPEYNYVIRNCGDYVRAMLKVVDPTLQPKKRATDGSFIEGVTGLNETDLVKD